METSEKLTTEEMIEMFRNGTMDIREMLDEALKSEPEKPVVIPEDFIPAPAKCQPYFKNFIGGWLLSCLVFLLGGMVMLISAITMDELALYITAGILAYGLGVDLWLYHKYGRG